ncbi:LuxR family transcriptional regulator [Gordonia sp. QH-12]|uniref:helix-turn-helix transcriptional regulator n=1 Tax=Gordonia sp. QH-12 TaxID=1437876 RepID=UPI000781A9F7|nr:helix-turn-helix transcriptional regulator [Gordonia sp. QH-12]KXT55770.1 LuxR family transcriptional regulator [Gordonia sp. QH-12]
MTVTAIAAAPAAAPATREAARTRHSRGPGSASSGAASAVDRRRREALARLSARVMPLPGRPLYAAPAPATAGRQADAAVPAARLPQPTLTDREVEVLRTWLMLDSKPAVAEALYISLGTVNTHLTRIRAKYAELGRPASTKAALVARAIQDDIVDIDEL